LPDVAKHYIDKYSYYDNVHNLWLMTGDNDKFMNHSVTPNTTELENGDLVAVRDIIIGEEITMDYFKLDGHHEEKF